MDKQDPMGQLDVGDAVDTYHVSPTQNIAPWLKEVLEHEGFRSLKEVVFGNCRALYGSDRSRFYDILVCGDQENMHFCAVLTCNQNGVTKMLRKAISTDAKSAILSLVDHIVKDSALLFTKYDVGSAWEGQQGFKNKTTGKFELDPSKQSFPIDGPADLMPSPRSYAKRSGDFYTPSGAPTGPRNDRNGKKRYQGSSNNAEDGVPSLADFY